MVWFVLGLVVGALAVAVVVLARSRYFGDTASTDLVPAPQLDVRPAGDEVGPDADLALWWDERPVMTLTRLDDRELPSITPVAGSVSTLLAGFLDDPKVRDLLAGDRFAVVRVPDALRSHGWVRRVDGQTVSVLRDPAGRFAGFPTLIGGAGAAVVAPAVAAAVVAAFAQNQLESTMRQLRQGMERIEARLDDVEHGVIIAAQTQMNRIGASTTGWSELTVAEVAAHRASLERVYATARRRVDRHLELLKSGDRFPQLEPGQVQEIQRDFVLLTDAGLVRGQMELQSVLAMLGGDAPDAALERLAQAEEALRNELATLSRDLVAVTARAEPGWINPMGRRRAISAKSELGQTLAGLDDMVVDLSETGDAELVVHTVAGQLEVGVPARTEPPGATAASDPPG